MCGVILLVQSACYSCGECLEGEEYHGVVGLLAINFFFLLSRIVYILNIENILFS